MRRWMFGAVIASGCFNPTGDTASGGSGPTSSATTSGSTPTSTSSGTTPSSESDTTASTGGVAGTAGSTTTTTPTSSTDPTGTATTDPTGATTSGAGCNPGCGPCATCVDGSCEDKAPQSPCTPPAGACTDLVWGVQGESCHLAAASGGECGVGGECEPKCENMGEVLVACTDSACIRPGNPCKPNALAVDVDALNFCSSGGETTPNCTSTCDPLAGEIFLFTCEDGGACTSMMSVHCGGFACNHAPLQCKETCGGPLDCALNFTCQNSKCVPG